MRFAALALALGIGVASEARADVASDRVLLVVGSSQGLVGEWPLTYSVQDAERFAEVMQQLGDVASEHVIQLHDPTRAEFIRGLRDVAAIAKPSSTVIVFYSGHGSESALHLKGERVEREELRRQLAGVKAALKLVITDACRGAVTGKGFSETRPFDLSLTRPAGYRGTVFLSAAGSGEDALESNSLKSGVFTHHLISALRGAADQDLDGRVSLFEAYDYAYAGTIRTSSGSGDRLQHPTLDATVEGMGALVLTRIAPARSLLTLPAAMDEQYIVFEKGSEAALVETWAKPGQTSFVALPAGQFIVHRRNRDGYAAAEVTLPFGGTKELGDESFVRASTLTTAPKGASYALRANAVGLGLGVLLDQHSHVGPSLRLSYARGHGHWAPTIGASFTMRSFEAPLHDVSQTSVDFGPGFEYRASLGSFNLALGAEAFVSWMTQRLRSSRPHEARSDWDSALAVGGLARATLMVPLEPTLSWQVDSSLGARVFRQDDGSGGEHRMHVELTLMVLSGPRISF